MIYHAYAICDHYGPIDTSSDGPVAVYDPDNSDWNDLQAQTAYEPKQIVRKVVIVDAETWGKLRKLLTDATALGELEES